MPDREAESIQVSAEVLAAAERIQGAFFVAASGLEWVRGRLLLDVRALPAGERGDLIEWLHGRAAELDALLQDTRKAIEAQALEDALTGFAERER